MQPRSSDQAATERKIPDAPYLAKASDASSGLDAVEKGEKRFVDVAKELFFFPRSVSCTDPMHMIWNSFEASIKDEEALWTVYEKRLRGILLFLGHTQRRTRWLQIAPPHCGAKTIVLWLALSSYLVEMGIYEQHVVIVVAWRGAFS